MILKVWFHNIVFTGGMKVISNELAKCIIIYNFYIIVYADYNRTSQEELTVRRGDVVGLVDKDSFDAFWKVSAVFWIGGFIMSHFCLGTRVPRHSAGVWYVRRQKHAH